MLWDRPEYKYGLFQKLCMHLIKLGPIPKHVAIIMDGNRRFAASQNMDCSSGHTQGFHKLSEVICWCHDLGIEELSVFAFSVDNFNRSEKEVSFLFDLATAKLEELLGKIDTLCSLGVCVRVLGDLSMLPTRIQRIATELMLKTRFNTKLALNICMAYGGQNELAAAAERIRLGVRDKLIHPSDINPDILSRCLYTRSSRPLDLYLRTSGEVRLSDFLVWQAAQSGVVHSFVERHWPQFSFWDFLGAIFYYQLASLRLSKLDSSDSSTSTVYPGNSDQNFSDKSDQSTLRIRHFLDQLDRSYWADLEKLNLSCQNLSNTDSRNVQRSVGDSLLS